MKTHHQARSNDPFPSQVHIGQRWVHQESQTSKIMSQTLTLSDQHGYTSKQLHSIIFKKVGFLQVSQNGVLTDPLGLGSL